MTREEAIARIKEHKNIHKMNEPRAILISEALDIAIEALEQEPILDKIRTEIIDKYMTATGEVNTVAKGCLQIIDKYKAESEPQESEEK